MRVALVDILTFDIRIESWKPWNVSLVSGVWEYPGLQIWASSSGFEFYSDCKAKAKAENKLYRTNTLCYNQFWMLCFGSMQHSTWKGLKHSTTVIWTETDTKTRNSASIIAMELELDWNRIGKKCDGFSLYYLRIAALLLSPLHAGKQAGRYIVSMHGKYF